MQRKQSLRIVIESPSGERFEAEVAFGVKLSKLAADFFEDRGWPMQDARGRGQRAVVELVNPPKPDDFDDTKRLNADLEIENSGVRDGDVLRIYPETIVGPCYDDLGKRVLGVESRLIEQRHEFEERAKELENRLRESVSFVDEIAAAVKAGKASLHEHGEQIAHMGSRIKGAEDTLRDIEQILGRREPRSSTQIIPLADPRPSQTVTWLHFSDMHLCQPRNGWNSRHIIESFLDDLRCMRDSGVRPDIVFFTGDAAFGHLGEQDGCSISSQFGEATRVFGALLTNVFPDVTPTRLFLVPGNHDVNRSALAPAMQEWLTNRIERDPIAGLLEIEEMMRTKDRNWRLCMEGLQDYREFLNCAHLEHLLNNSNGLGDRLIYAQVCDIRGVRIGIGGLNSAWGSACDGQKGRLWLGGRWQIQTLESELNELDKVDFTVALVHHPLSWFAEAESSFLNTGVERAFDFLLHGHEHQNWVSQFGNRHVRIAAGASYSKVPSESGYSLVQVDVAERTADVWLRRYDELGGGWIPRIIHDRTDDRGVWTIKNLRLRRQAAAGE